jgi:hypothetical protein
MVEIGLDERHVLLCINKDTDRLLINEKVKQSYMFLTRTMFIENEPITPGIDPPNRCYFWLHLGATIKPTEVEEYYEEEDDIHCVENDFYHGLRVKINNQMDDANNSMIVLRYE